ncbi:ubiquitin thioesterase Otu1-like [Artemia franciscana]|uniref:Ubiquitin thioesterase OTU n=1 Tax=Artemia franciscana TaxID=6661 RepID=A0AA88L8P3_ARTSF|nr:hypothetical protein QYM36_002956 [Artemia franciscana]KAK2722591.1 hypothetical protein QYM36_002956 [Artemia franciscana]KAK2722592.1 hypothetical protein QYM36_002956 [Artemia franciscana]KAK2722593.1 hypothetical protein QYM36_002956 [Artemia franciscana]
MANENLQLKVKHEQGQFVLSSLKLSDLLKDLKEKISDSIKCSPDRIRILRGYPPLPIDYEDSTELGKCGIEKRDILVVETIKPPKKEEIDKLEGKGASPSAVKQLSKSKHGFLTRKVIPSDNSCLFTSVSFCLTGKVDLSQASYLREVVMSTIQSNPEIYSAAFLGKPPLEYCQWIMRDDSWGGGIECSVLANYFGMEIAVVDTQHGIINKFGEDQNYGQRVLLIYDGIHYDVLYMEAVVGGVLQTIFPTEDESILKEAEELAAEARASHQYTSTSDFLLICLDCSKILTGEKEAQQHAMESKHINFDEVRT